VSVHQLCGEGLQQRHQILNALQIRRSLEHHLASLAQSLDLGGHNDDNPNFYPSQLQRVWRARCGQEKYLDDHSKLNIRFDFRSITVRGLYNIRNFSRRCVYMSKEIENKAIVGRWFTEFWGKNCDLKVIDELAAPDMRNCRSISPIK
jgi:hypothetical protein